METYREYVGNPHVHSVYSDGAATYREIAAAANAAALNFVIVTDHNVRPVGLETYHDQVLILSGEEVHNVRRSPQANHLLIYGAEHEMAPYAFSSTRTLIQAARSRDGACYIAHPIEKGSRISPDLAAIPWSYWPPEDIHGIEIWNYMSEFKGLLWSRLAAVIYAFRPEWGIRGPYRRTLRLWDELLAQGYRIGALGGADAHGTTYTWGPIQRKILPYDYLFRCVNTHVLTEEPLTGDVDTDKQLIYNALRAGRTWVGYDLPHTTRGFRFRMESGSASAVPGEELRRLGAINITVTLPASGEIHLLKNGDVIQKAVGHSLTYTSAEAGIYRIEVYRRFKARRVGWIFTSPIFVV
ncbi:MAG: CehA/McbA family metallohydrolase [Anaerolineae bacterium]